MCLLGQMFCNGAFPIRRVKSGKYGCGIVYNPNLIRKTRSAAATWEKQMYSQDLARDPRVTDTSVLVERLAESEDEGVLLALAEVPEFSLDMEVVIRRDGLPWGNPQSAPYAILRDQWIAHESAAPQPDLHSETVRAVVRHPDKHIRCVSASNLVIGQFPEAIDALASAPPAATRSEIARRLANNARSVWRGRMMRPGIIPGSFPVSFFSPKNRYRTIRYVQPRISP